MQADQRRRSCAGGVLERWLSALSGGDCIKWMVVCGLLQVAAYYLGATCAAGGSHAAPPQHDTLLYCQSARQIAEGMPFVYTPGDKPSTGCTSHLYPFALAALYKCGATGDGLLAAGFLLNALFYLVFLFNWGVIAGRLVKKPLARTVACALLALNGHSAFSALAQSDVGLFLAVSSGLFASLLAGRFGWFAFLMVLAPWCHPEGVVLAFAYTAFLLLRKLWGRQRVVGGEWGLGVAGILSSLAVFAFNHWLTGYVQFQSVYYKGYFKMFDFASAWCLTLRDAARMAKEFLLGIPETVPREMFFLPALGALFAWTGLLRRSWRQEDGAWKEGWWLSVCVLSMGVIASSGWQNTNTDRYLAWMLPIWLIYEAEGVEWLLRKLVDPVSRVTPVLVALGFQGLAACWFITFYYSMCLSSEKTYAFAQEVHQTLPPGARVGGESGAGIAYALHGRRFVHLSGIYTPDLLEAPDVVLNLERLKHRPDLRFDYWVFRSEQAEFGGARVDSLCGEVAAFGLNGDHVRPARWGCLDLARLPPDGDRTSDGWRLVDAVDVGYPDDEKRSGYEVFNRFDGAVCSPFAVTGKKGENTLFEVGRMVPGGDSMSVRLTPHQPVRVVLRTVSQAEAQVRLGIRRWPQAFTVASPLKLNVQADGVDVSRIEQAFSTQAGAMTDVRFTLPAEAIKQPELRLSFYGDHVALGYWFYQPVP